VHRAGDRVEVLGLLSGTRPPANPGEFDLARFYRRTGIGASLWSNGWAGVKVVTPGADGLRRGLGAIRRFAMAGFAHVPDARMRSVLEAIVLGRRDRLEESAGNGKVAEEELEQAFIKTGTAHFLAVSGLHVGMMAAFVAFVLRMLCVPRRWAAIVVIAFVIFYASLADFRPSVVRAGVITGVFCLGWLLGRRGDPLNSLAAGVILILFVAPHDLFLAGFQLSFLIACGLVFVAPRIEGFLFWRGMQAIALSDAPFVPSRWYRVKRRLRQLVSYQIAAPLISYAYVAYKFHFVTLLGPVITVLSFFLIYAILILGFGMIATGWWLGAAAQVMGYAAEGCCGALLWLLQKASHVPYMFSYTRGFAWPWLVAAYGVIALWVFRERLRISRRRMALIALAISVALVWFGLGPMKRDRLRVTLISVGSANMNLIQFPNGRNILYDAGASYSSSRATAYSIAPALWSLGVDRIDAVFISHPHFDHFKEILQVAARFPIGRVYVPRAFMRSDKRADNIVVEDVIASGIPVEYIAPGQTLAGLGDVRLDVLWPTAEVDEEWTVNDSSLVVRVSSGDMSVLLTGDLEGVGIDALLRRGVPECDVVLWPHHGGESASVHRLFERTRCKAVVVSASRAFTARYQDESSGVPYRLYHTGRDGAVTVELGQGEVEVRTFHPGAAGG
jgi:competence protein ComEC